jgi:phage terminase large subunit GpA-like protein
MLSKCANPECSATFRYLSLGKVFRAEIPAGIDRRRATMGDGDSMNKALRRLEFYWLCEHCARKMTLVFDKEAGVTVHPVASAKSAAA